MSGKIHTVTERKAKHRKTVARVINYVKEYYLNTHGEAIPWHVLTKTYNSTFSRLEIMAYPDVMQKLNDNDEIYVMHTRKGGKLVFPGYVRKVYNEIEFSMLDLRQWYGYEGGHTRVLEAYTDILDEVNKIPLKDRE